jgi:hypothetical protein
MAWQRPTKVGVTNDTTNTARQTSQAPLQKDNWRVDCAWSDVSSSGSSVKRDLKITSNAPQPPGSPHSPYAPGGPTGEHEPDQPGLDIHNIPLEPTFDHPVQKDNWRVDCAWSDLSSNGSSVDRDQPITSNASQPPDSPRSPNSPGSPTGPSEPGLDIRNISLEPTFDCPDE